ncbi:MAG: sulfatase-like hydrolase/transferase, partial [Deltaproteobacteria bacterium]
MPTPTPPQDPPGPPAPSADDHLGLDRGSPVPPARAPARPRRDRPRLRAAGLAARRALAALAASFASPLVAGALSGLYRAPLDRRGGAIREAALFLPLAVPLAMVLVPLALLVSRARVDAVLERLRRDEGTARVTAATLLLAPPAVAAWIALLARADRFFLTAFHHVGLASLAQATALAVLSLGCAGVYAAVHRALARAIPVRAARRSVPWLAVGLGLAVAIVAVGITTGDTDGRGRWFGAFGVLKKSELDLSPVYALAGLGAIALALTLALSRSALAALVVLLGSGGAGALSFRHVARHFSDAPSAASVDARPGVARTMLRLLRKRTDRDHDGASGLFGGGDCNDRDPHVFPAAHDVPGNGLDEDCSGRDAPLPPPPPPPPPPTLGERLARETPADMNVVLITVDTMRWDLHYAGNPRELSPSMDRLAAASVVFDHAYALSSYTGRAIAPLMAGRYPTECARDSEHFTQYPGSNILLAERLRDAGFATFGGASHFYFDPRFGLVQGM